MELLLLYRNSCPRCDKSLRDSIEGYILLELLTIIFIEENIRVTLYTVKREIHAIPFDQWFFLPLSCFSISKKLNAKNRNWRFELICEGVEGRKTKNKARQIGEKAHFALISISFLSSPRSRPTISLRNLLCATRIHARGRGPPLRQRCVQLNHAPPQTPWMENYEENKVKQSFPISIDQLTKHTPNSANFNDKTRFFHPFFPLPPRRLDSPSRLEAVSRTRFDDDDVNLPTYPPCPGWVQRTSKATTPLPTLGGNVHHHLHPSISPSPTDLATYLPTYLPPPTTLDRPPSLRTL